MSAVTSLCWPYSAAITTDRLAVTGMFWSHRLNKQVHSSRGLYTHIETNACLFTWSIQDGTVQEKTSQIPRHGRPISAVPWILFLTSASSRSTAGREATTPTESTRWCPARTHTDAGEVKHVLEHSQTDLMWQPDYITCCWWLVGESK